MAGKAGSSGGSYGVGKRIKLAYARAIVDAIHSGVLTLAKTQQDPIFGFEVLTECHGVPSDILNPKSTWADKTAYDETAKRLAGLFRNNLCSKADGISPWILLRSRTCGPAVS